LVSNPSVRVAEKATRRLVSSALSTDQLVEDLQRIMPFARRGHASLFAREPLIKRRSRSLMILVADDNAVNQKVIRLMLEAGGHKVVIADDGEQALDKLDAQHFDLVVMDLNMPVLDGIEATKLYRMGAIGSRHVPIVGLTADATPAAAERAKEAGMDACLTKPINGPFLLDQIDELTARHMQAGSQPQAPLLRTVPAGEQAPVDVGMLENLRTLGGPAFLREVISTFLVDGEGILTDLQDAVAQANVTQFSEKVHALQSGAVNIGALALAEQCGLWRPKSADDLRANGPVVLDRVRSDFEAVRAHFLREYVSSQVLILDPRKSDPQ
jgi:two-component system sensor histidine kinase RpfC